LGSATLPTRGGAITNRAETLGGALAAIEGSWRQVLGQRVVEVVGVVHARALLDGTDAVVAGFEEGQDTRCAVRSKAGSI